MKEIVYISYTRNDSDLAKYLATILENNNIDVWLDVKDIRGGNNIEEEIVKGLNKSTSMIVLLSESSFSSNYVRDEIEYALLNNKLQNRILPVFIKEKNKIDYSKLPWILRKINFLVIDSKNNQNKNVNLIKEEYFRMIRGR